MSKRLKELLNIATSNVQRKAIEDWINNNLIIQEETFLIDRDIVKDHHLDEIREDQKRSFKAGVTDKIITTDITKKDSLMNVEEVKFSVIALVKDINIKEN